MTQFSELHDASSKPWIQISSFTTLVFLLLTQNCSGLPQVVGPSQPILATVGGDVVLSCRLEPAADASGMSIEWSRKDLDPSYVYVWWDKEELESSKHPDYKGRTSLLFSELEFGDVSLKLSKVKPSDEGKYICFIPTLGEESTVELVVGAVSLPVFSLAGLGRTSSSVELECKSAGWYPEPEVLWLDGDGNLLSAGPTKKIRGPDDLYTVSSRVTVEKKHGNNKLNCRVQQNNIKQTREALIQVTDDFFIIQSSYTSNIVGLAVSLAAAFILLILAVVLFVRTRRHKMIRKIRTLEKTNQQLKGNNSETNNQLQQEKQKNEKSENDMKTLKNHLEELKGNNSETNNQLQQERQKNEKAENEMKTLKNHLEEEKQENETLDSRLKEFMKTKGNLLDEKLKLMKTERKLKNKIQNQIQELDEMNFDSNFDSTGNNEKNQQEELEKQKWMKIVGNLKTELQNMNKKLKLTGSITVEDVNEYGFYIRLKNISSEEIKLEGWKLELQKNNRESAEYRFNESVKLQAGEILTIYRSSSWFFLHPDDVDLRWSDMMEWWPEDKLQIKLISNDGKTFKLL